MFFVSHFVSAGLEMNFKLLSPGRQELLNPSIAFSSFSKKKAIAFSLKSSPIKKHYLLLSEQKKLMPMVPSLRSQMWWK
jgi:hypothetical protein